MYTGNILSHGGIAGQTDYTGTTSTNAVGYVNIKNIYRQPRMSKFESEAPAAEEMLDHVVCSSKQFSFQTCIESGDGSGTFRNWRQRIPDSWCRDTECFGLEVDPCRRPIE